MLVYVSSHQDEKPGTARCTRSILQSVSWCLSEHVDLLSMESPFDQCDQDERDGCSAGNNLLYERVGGPRREVARKFFKTIISVLILRGVSVIVGEGNYTWERHVSTCMGFSSVLLCPRQCDGDPLCTQLHFDELLPRFGDALRTLAVRISRTAINGLRDSGRERRVSIGRHK